MGLPKQIFHTTAKRTSLNYQSDRKLLKLRAASTGKTGKTSVLPGFPAGKTWSYLDFLKEAEVLSRKGNQPFPYYFHVLIKIFFCFDKVSYSKQY